MQSMGGVNSYEPDTLVGEKKAAEIIGLSVRTLQQRRYLHQPPKYIRLPGTRTIRYRLSDLVSFIEHGVVDCGGEV